MLSASGSSSRSSGGTGSSSSFCCGTVVVVVVQMAVGGVAAAAVQRSATSLRAGWGCTTFFGGEGERAIMRVLEHDMGSKLEMAGKAEGRRKRERKWSEAERRGVVTCHRNRGSAGPGEESRLVWISH